MNPQPSPARATPACGALSNEFLMFAKSTSILFQPPEGNKAEGLDVPAWLSKENQPRGLQGTPAKPKLAVSNLPNWERSQPRADPPRHCLSSSTS